MVVGIVIYSYLVGEELTSEKKFELLRVYNQLKKKHGIVRTYLIMDGE
jgi:hypothetical protein